MRSFYMKGAAWALGAACLVGNALVGNAQAQYSQYATPSMLPDGRYPTYTAYQDQLQLPAPPAPTSESLHIEETPHVHGSGGHGLYADGGAIDESCAEIVQSVWQAPRCGWFGSVGGLIMTRSDENELWFSYDDAIITSQIIGSRDANMDYTGGAEVRFGQYFNGGKHAVEVVYWGIDPNDSEFNALGSNMTGNLDATFSFNSLEYNDGSGVSAVNDWFQGAQRQRLRRNFNFQNVEVNFLNYGNAINCDRLNVGFIAGFRYLKFNEDLNFASDDFDTNFTGDAREVYYSSTVDNQMYGFQLGADASYRLTNRFSLRSRTKFGLFNNNIQHTSFVGGSTGAAVVNVPTSPYNGQAFDINTTKNDVSFVGELDLGIDCRISHRWSASLGYRAVAYSGVALSTTQFPANFDDLGGARRVESNGNLILHGGYGSLEFNY